MGLRVGIDLGTTFSAVARINENTRKPEMIKTSSGSSVTPSVLCFNRDGRILFGEEAKELQGLGDTNAVAFFKRSMGNDNFCVEFFGKTYNSTDLSAIFLKLLVSEAEKTCGEKITSAVITVPAYFMHKEREATIEAGKRAGLDVIAIINEPTAAAFAYGLNEKEGEQTVLIYDLGGGTFDVTIAKINQNRIDILGSDGNHELGGKDWDDCIARYLAQSFQETYGLDLSEDEEMITSLLVTAENVKKQLTYKDEVKVLIYYKNICGSLTVTEEKFEEISDFLIGETKDLTNELIEEVGLTWADISGVILVGGSTRMRMIHSYVKEMSGKEPLFGVNVDEAVALGAAIRANIDEDGKSLSDKVVDRIGGRFGFSGVIGAKAVSDVTAHALGMIAISEDGEKYINSIMISKNTTIPASKKKSYQFDTGGRNPELEVYVLQGGFERPLDNVLLNKYTITGIEKTKNNTTIIDVTYYYTSNGVVEVKALQSETGKVLPIRIEKNPEDMSWTDRSPKKRVQPKKQNMEVILAIDLSGSMIGTPLSMAKKAMENFVNSMNPSRVKIGILGFADNAIITVSPTKGFSKVMRGIQSLAIGGEFGIANTAEPFTQSHTELIKGNEKEDGIAKYIVVLTDGVWSNQPFAIKQAKICHESGIDVIALGFGGADYEFLKQIASLDDFASLTDLSKLSESFSRIAQVIGEGDLVSNIKIV